MPQANVAEITVGVMLAAAIWLGLRWWAIAVRGLRRRQHGLCVQCGYDLTGLRAARCPECGRSFRTDRVDVG